MKTEADIRLLAVAVVATGNALVREAGRLFKPQGVSAGQFNILNLLAEEPAGLRPSTVAAALVVDPSSATYQLDRMEARGWLRRVREGGDRRAWRVSLTAAGRAMQARVTPLYFQALRGMAAGLKGVKFGATAVAVARMQDAARVAVDQVLVAPRPGRRRS
jgi:DNA-binding MarR family transcriptional regulator